VETTTDSNFSSDAPITTIEQDELGYRYFAQNLVRAIKEIPAPQGFVIAINGRWGLGKSSIVEMMLCYIESETQDEETPFVFRFSPWMFSDQKELANQFFSQLAGVLIDDEPLTEEEQQKEKRLKRQRAGWRLLEYGARLFSKENVKAVVSHTEELKNMAGETAAAVDPMASMTQAYASTKQTEINKKLEKYDPSTERDIHTHKKHIEEDLQELAQQILVVVDDIDRLYPDEIRQLFRVIKAAANFQNVLYLLVFDKKIVSEALKTDAIDGNEYLEKIVQVSFDIPLPSREQLANLLLKRLKPLTKDVPEHLLNWGELEKMFPAGVWQLISTPRHIVRFVNAMRLTYSWIKEDVNIVDFVLIESLRQFAPGVYNAIRQKKLWFATSAEMLLMDRNKDGRIKEYHEKWMADVSDDIRDAVKEIVIYLFPQVATFLGESLIINNEVEQDRTLRRINHNKFFDLYFQLNIPENALSQGEVEQLVNSTAEKSTLQEHLLSLASNSSLSITKLRAWLNELAYQSEKGKLPVLNLTNIIQVALRIGDDCVDIDTEESILVDDQAALSALRKAVVKSIESLPKERQSSTLLYALDTGNSIDVAVEVITDFGTDHATHPYGRKRPAEEQRFNLSEMQQMEERGLSRIQTAATSGELVKSPSLLSILYRWQAWGNEQDPVTWVQEQAKTDAGFVQLMLTLFGMNNRDVDMEIFKQVFGFSIARNIQPFIPGIQFRDRVLNLDAEMLQSQKEKEMITALKKIVAVWNPESDNWREDFNVV